MNEEDERGAQKVAVMIVSMLLFATALVCFSCYRICKEDWLRKKQKRLGLTEAPVEIEPIRIGNVINRTPQNPDVTTAQQNDHQVVFGSLTFSDTAEPEINQSTIRHCPLTELQNEYERRALERRGNLNNTDPLPPYSTEDASLPSYDQVLKNGVDDKI